MAFNDDANNLESSSPASWKAQPEQCYFLQPHQAGSSDDGLGTILELVNDRNSFSNVHVQRLVTPARPACQNSLEIVTCLLRHVQLIGSKAFLTLQSDLSIRGNIDRAVSVSIFLKDSVKFRKSVVQNTQCLSIEYQSDSCVQDQAVLCFACNSFLDCIHNSTMTFTNEVSDGTSSGDGSFFLVICQRPSNTIAFHFMTGLKLPTEKTRSFMSAYPMIQRKQEEAPVLCSSQSGLILQIHKSVEDNLQSDLQIGYSESLEMACWVRCWSNFERLFHRFLSCFSSLPRSRMTFVNDICEKPVIFMEAFDLPEEPLSLPIPEVVVTDGIEKLLAAQAQSLGLYPHLFFATVADLLEILKEPHVLKVSLQSTEGCCRARMFGGMLSFSPRCIIDSTQEYMAKISDLSKATRFLTVFWVQTTFGMTNYKVCELTYSEMLAMVEKVKVLHQCVNSLAVPAA